jgi:hypothetical protein
VSRGPGRWERLILDELQRIGDIAYLRVSEAACIALDRSLTPSEYRALNRAAWLLRTRGRLHLGKALAPDYTGRMNQTLVAWTCVKCSHGATGEHIPALPCAYCKEPTERRNYGDHPDCGCVAREMVRQWESAGMPPGIWTPHA